MHYNLIEYHNMKNAILRKDFNLDVTSSFFHIFTHMLMFITNYMNASLRKSTSNMPYHIWFDLS
jgi:hypothetical protein